MNQIINITQDSQVLLEYVYQDKIKVKIVKRRGEGRSKKPILVDGEIQKEQIVKEIDSSERRRGIGGVLFEKRPGYKFPVIELTGREAQRILRAEEIKKTRFFRIAVPVDKDAKPEPDKTG